MTPPRTYSQLSTAAYRLGPNGVLVLTDAELKLILDEAGDLHAIAGGGEVVNRVFGRRFRVALDGEPIPGSTHARLVDLWVKTDPDTISHIELDAWSVRDLRQDRVAMLDGSNTTGDRSEMLWRTIGIRVVGTPLLELFADDDGNIGEVPSRPDPVQVTLVCRRRDNFRLYYLDHPDNADLWKKHGPDR